MTDRNESPRGEDQPVAIRFADGFLHVTLQDGRIISTPLVWYPRLVEASPEQLANYELGLTGIHWPDIDEDLSVAGMLRGSRPPQRQQDMWVETA